MSRYFAIGDIHGCIKTVTKLLIEIDPKPGDTIVYLGDYVDRGPKSKEVIELVRNHRPHGVNVVALKGNHEDMMVRALRGEADMYWWLRNGGEATINSFEHEISPELLQWLDELPLFHETPEYFFVHAGIQYGLPLDRQHAEVMMWIRDWYGSEQELASIGKTVVHGHTPVKQPGNLARAINVDTGCVYAGYGRLTCVVLGDGERKFIQIPRMD